MEHDSSKLESPEDMTAAEAQEPILQDVLNFVIERGMDILEAMPKTKRRSLSDAHGKSQEKSEIDQNAPEFEG